MRSNRTLSVVAVAVLLGSSVPISSTAVAAEHAAAPTVVSTAEEVSTRAVTVEVPAAVGSLDVPETDDEATIAILYALLDADPDGAVRRDGDAALAGSPEDRVSFLESGLQAAHEEDDEAAVAQILADPDAGVAVRRDASAALDSDDPAVIREFLETGLAVAQAEDDRVDVFRLLADPDSGSAVVAGAEEALDDGSAEALREFLETGLAAARDEDNRFDILVALNDLDAGSPARDAAEAALDGTTEDRAIFLEIYRAGWCEVAA